MSIAADLTINTLSFNQKWSDEDGSVRTETSRGVNLPTEMKIAHAKYTDSKTKLPGNRSLVRFDRTVAGVGGNPVVVSAYVVVMVPEDTAIVAGDITAVVGHILGLLDNTSPNLDKVSDVFVSRLQ